MSNTVFGAEYELAPVTGSGTGQSLILEFDEDDQNPAFTDEGISPDRSIAQDASPVLDSLCVTKMFFEAMGMMDSEQERLDMAPFFTELPPTNFARVAEACGAQGLRVEEPGALAEGLHRALAARRPFVVDVAIDPLERESSALEPVTAMARA